MGWGGGALVAGLYCLPTLLDDEHSGDGDHGEPGGDGDDHGEPGGDGDDYGLVVMMNRVVIRVARMSRLS